MRHTHSVGANSLEEADRGAPHISPAVVGLAISLCIAFCIRRFEESL
jgi:hypothetical protein